MIKIFFKQSIIFSIILSVSVFSISCKPAKTSIVIGAPLPTAFLEGWVGERGIKLAVEEINAAGGVSIGGKKLPFQVEMIDTRDLEMNVPVNDALMGLEKLILEKKADFIIGGPARSEAALAAMDLLSKHKKISILSIGVLTPAYHKKVESDYTKYKYCFRITSHVGIMSADFMAIFEEIKKSSGFNNVYIMVQDVEHAKRAADNIKKLLTEKKWNVLDTKIYPTGASDFSIGLNDAKNKGADIIFLWMDMPESSILLKQWSDMKLKALPMGYVNAGQQPGFWKATGGKGEYLIVNLVNGGNAPANKISPWTSKFVEAYKKKYGLEPEGYGTSSSYMAVYTLKEAIEKAGTTETDDVIKALENLSLMGAYGRIAFDKKSHQVIPSDDPEKGVVTGIIQWQKETRVQIFPLKTADGKILLPPWMN